MNLYVMRDKKSQTVSAPFAAVNDGIACRQVVEAMRDKESMVAKWPKDFQLMHVGEYAEDDGALSPAKEVRLVVELSVLDEAGKAN